VTAMPWTASYPAAMRWDAKIPVGPVDRLPDAAGQLAEVCVIGVPDAYRGQSPKAFVALKAGAGPITLDAMKAFLADKIGKHEMIGALEVRDALPKTPVGKLSKKTLVDEEAARQGVKP
jgi:acyl-coenzyme A synthetase/AMP-(fatty) acid ligase